MHMPALLQTSLPVVQQLPLPQANLPGPPAAEQAHFSGLPYVDTLRAPSNRMRNPWPRG